MKKTAFLASLLTDFSLFAAVDEVNSYFTVSKHADVIIYLRDAENKPVRTTDIAVESTSFDVAVVEAPKAGANGMYRARIKADVATDAEISVVAEGVTIQENILPNPSFEFGVGSVPGYVSTYANMYDYSSFGWAKNGYKSNRSLESYAFDPQRSTYWGIATVEGASLLKDRLYEISFYTKYDNVVGEYGVTLQTTQRSTPDTVVPGGNSYNGKHLGNSSDWIRLSAEEPVKIMEKATAVNFSAVILAASGHVQFDAARLRVTPTIRWGQPEASIRISRPGSCRMFPNLTFVPALKLTVDEYDKALAEAQKAAPGNEALQPFVADQAKYHQYLAGKLTAAEAFEKRLEILKRIPQIKEARKGAADKELENLL